MYQNCPIFRNAIFHLRFYITCVSFIFQNGKIKIFFIFLNVDTIKNATSETHKNIREKR